MQTHALVFDFWIFYYEPARTHDFPFQSEKLEGGGVRSKYPGDIGARVGASDGQLWF
jgi:hypothetical protein